MLSLLNQKNDSFPLLILFYYEEMKILSLINHIQLS